MFYSYLNNDTKLLEKHPSVLVKYKSQIEYGMRFSGQFFYGLIIHY